MGSCQDQDTSHSFHNARTYPLQEVFTHPLLRCLSTEEGIHILQEIHNGCCGAHADTRNLANKALRAGYFWPTMKQDAIQLWRMDIVGPFPLAAGQRKFFLVVIDYFTKWVEAEPLARITEGEAEEYKNGVKGCTSGKEFTTVTHPQANGQVEVTNRILVQGIKRRLERVGGTGQKS
ncbi:UNVERIFIED_CONTAM: hypothetical protein Slati_3072600 [Sesamum latifolium]|uniref:Uncharacterized protein n=1 Tax=Sesamum latifolium TaxID=2727402 RepID=A0AAW2UVI8_9LAMI